MRSRKTRQIAPRLANGDVRVPFGMSFPPEVLVALQAIARHENRSLSWAIQRTCIRFFHLTEPKYVERKKK